MSSSIGQLSAEGDWGGAAMLSLIKEESISQHLEHWKQPVKLGLTGAKQSKGGVCYCQEGQGRVESLCTQH